MQNPEDNRPPRIAVLGVHGIGHHEPGATANAMADLLLSLPSFNPKHPNSDVGSYYDSFQSVDIRVPLRPVRVRPTEIGARRPRMLSVYEEKSTAFADKASAYVRDHIVERGQTGNAYTQLLLEQYQGGADGDFYATNRLEGKRTGGASGSDAEVHIYEVLWADLARPTNTFLSFFLALFQLILHLGSLSRLAIDSGAAERTGAFWHVYRALQRYAVRMLQIPLPILKLVLLVAFVASVPTVFAGLSGAPWLPPVLGAVAGLGAGLLVENKLRKPVMGGPWLWALTTLVPALAGAGAGSLLAYFARSEGATTIELWLLIGASLFSYVLAKYEGVRKGAKITGWIVYLLTFVVFMACLGLSKGNVSEATFWTSEWILAALRFSWWLLFAFAILALFIGSLAWRSIKDDAARARARAAVRTSRFALALPLLLFVQITSLIWASLFFLERKLPHPLFDLSGFRAPEWQVRLARLTLIPDPGPILKEHQNYLKAVLAWSVGYQAPVSLALFLLALLFIGCWIFPGVITERFPLRDQQEPPRNSTNVDSVRLGSWLSRGLDATSVSTFLFWGAMFVAPIAYHLVPQYQDVLKKATFWIVTDWIVLIAGALLAAMVKYGSPILSAVLDVDNYLRTEPADATPRAKIFERYVSTLRYIARYRGADGQPYDAVVIVGHSLGTLISADLLRFLHAVGDPELAAMGLGGREKKATIKIKLLTMGSPIRQLLNRFFPYLYDWVRGIPDNGLAPLPHPTSESQPAIPQHALPDPAELGVSKWVNMYRSGDYVGRSLWLTEWYCRTSVKASSGSYPTPIYDARSDGRSEMCIGAGAHTHYWDDTAPDVAEQLNNLIGISEEDIDAGLTDLHPRTPELSKS